MFENLTGLNQLVELIINVVLVPLIIAGFGYVFKLVKSKINIVNSENDAAFFNFALETVEKFIYSTVIRIAETYVNKLKEEDKFDMDAQETAFNTVYEEVIKQIPDDMLQILNDGLGSDGFKSWMTSKIEEMVKISK